MNDFFLQIIISHQNTIGCVGSKSAICHISHVTGIWNTLKVVNIVNLRPAHVGQNFEHVHMYFSFFSVLSFLIWNFAVVKCSYLMRYSSNLSDLLSFHTMYNITRVLMIPLCSHWCPDDSTRVSLVEYSRSLRTCSPRYQIIHT